MIEFVHGKHVALRCNLTIGEIVTVRDYHYKFNHQDLTIEDIKRSTNCESGFLVKLKEMDNYIDSNWIDKLNELPK